MKKSKPVKILIKKMIRRYGSVEAVAIELHISKRYVQMLRDGKKRASWALAEIIRQRAA